MNDDVKLKFLKKERNAVLNYFFPRFIWHSYHTDWDWALENWHRLEKEYPNAKVIFLEFGHFGYVRMEFSNQADETEFIVREYI